MKRSIRRGPLLIGVLVLTFMALAACENLLGEDDTEDDQDAVKTATLAHPGWAEGIAFGKVAEAVLESEMNYEIALTELGPEDGLAAVADGTQDAFLDVWSVANASAVEDNSGSITELGTLYQNTRTGLAVPQYVYDEGVQAISDLESGSTPDDMSSTITGISSGAGIVQITENDIIPAYGLDDAGYSVEYNTVSDMTDKLSSAISASEYIVVTIWRPHWIWAQHDLQFLEEDQSTTHYGTEDIHVYGRTGLSDDDPELAQFLANMTFSDNQLNQLLLEIEESSDDPAAVATQWTSDNSAVVDSWIPN
ncbi:MAG: glycine betaine ABC transporter substrate-binding protein [Alkalispirochaeta sp.]